MTQKHPKQRVDAAFEKKRRFFDPPRQMAFPHFVGANERQADPFNRSFIECDFVIGINEEGCIYLSPGYHSPGYSQQDIAEIMSLLCLYYPYAPSEADILHRRLEYCGTPGCKICEEIYWLHEAEERFSYETLPHTDQPGTVFLAKVADYYMIGWSTEPRKRIVSIGRENKAKATLIASIETEFRHQVETYWHRHFVSGHIENKYFNLTEQQVAEFCHQEGVVLHADAAFLQGDMIE